MHFPPLPPIPENDRGPSNGGLVAFERGVPSLRVARHRHPLVPMIPRRPILIPSPEEGPRANGSRRALAQADNDSDGLIENGKGNTRHGNLLGGNLKGNQVQRGTPGSSYIRNAEGMP